MKKVFALLLIAVVLVMGCSVFFASCELLEWFEEEEEVAENEEAPVMVKIEDDYSYSAVGGNIIQLASPNGVFVKLHIHTTIPGAEEEDYYIAVGISGELYYRLNKATEEYYDLSYENKAVRYVKNGDVWKKEDLEYGSLIKESMVRQTATTEARSFFFGFYRTVNDVAVKTTATVAGRECDKYVLTGKTSEEDYCLEVCIDKETGACLRHIATGNAPGDNENYSIECVEFSTEYTPTLPTVNGQNGEGEETSDSISPERYKGIYFSGIEIEQGFNSSTYTRSVFTEKTLETYPTKISLYDLEGNAVNYSAQTGVYVYKKLYDARKLESVGSNYSKLSIVMRLYKDAEVAFNARNSQSAISNAASSTYYNEWIDFLQKYQAPVLNRYLTILIAGQLIDSGKVQIAGEDRDFLNAYVAITDYWCSRGPAPTDAMWNLVETVVAQHVTEEEKYACVIELLGALGYADKILPNRVEVEIADSIRRGTISAEEYASIKTEVNDFMVSNGYTDMNSATPFAYLPRENIYEGWEIYYSDKDNNKGSLPVLGYFEIHSTKADMDQPASQYLIDSFFMDEHATYVQP